MGGCFDRYVTASPSRGLLLLTQQKAEGFFLQLSRSFQDTSNHRTMAQPQGALRASKAGKPLAVTPEPYGS